MSTPFQSSSSIPRRPNNNIPIQTYRSHSNVYQYPIQHDNQNCNEQLQHLQNPGSMSNFHTSYNPNQNIYNISSPISRHLSDDQQKTIDHQTSSSPISLQYLLNQNKMKQIALNKATHLIDLLKLQLEVQRNSQQQSIEIIQNDLKQKYQHIIKDLEIKIEMLQRKIQQQKRKYNKLKEETNNMNEKSNINVNRDIMVSHLNNNKNTLNSTSKSKSKDNLLSDSTIRAPRLSKTNSSKQFPSTSTNTRNQRSSIRKLPPNQSRHSAICLPSTQQFLQQQNLANNLEQDLFKFDKTFILTYLLKQSQKDEKLIEQLKQIIQNNNQSNFQSSHYQYQYQQSSSVLSSKSFADKNIKSYEKIIDEVFKQYNKKLKEYENKFKDQKQIIKIHQLLVVQLNQKINEYDSTLKIFIRTFSQICQQLFKNDNNNNYNNNSSTYFSHAITDYSSSINPLSHYNSQPFSHPNFPTTQSFISSFNPLPQPDPVPLSLSHSIQKSQESLKFSVKKHKNFIKQKFISCQNQNKQLKRILDEMIKLIKSNKKINIGGITNIMRIKQG